ncbi:patatin family protein [Paraliobacillus zengyii]|uniref:patatin-like phospholipase family protein n=1 Tax=Paraliobacillus zengyii TaxID=2213194 RepID=UPI000DD39B22
MHALGQTGLILEGGGMRGAYTAGVLAFFHDAELQFPYVVGTSAGACVATSYLSNQRDRNYEVFVKYASHPEYISYKRLLTKRQLFGMDFIFDTVPNQLVPYDYEAFNKQTTKLVIGATDIYSGKPVYYDSFENKKELLKIVRASSSLPFIASSISHNGLELMDGGISDPIPIMQSIEAGNQKHVVVLTRNEGYVKKEMKFKRLVQRKYKAYPGLVTALLKRHEKYNQTIDLLHELEKKQEIFIIRPKLPLVVSRIERNMQKLDALYNQGYEEAKQLGGKLQIFLNQ